MNSRTSKNHIGGRSEKGMFDVELPEGVEKSSSLRNGHGRTKSKDRFGEDPPVMVDRKDSPTPYPCLMARLTLVFLNTVSLQCIGLAIGVSLFSVLLRSALEQSSADMTQLCGMNAYVNSMSTATQLIRKQAYGGFNATIWNMNQSAMASVKSELNDYVGAGVAICHAENVAAANATDRMAQWSVNTITKLRNTTVSLFDSLKDVELALQNSGYFNGSAGNISGLFDIEVPSASFQLNCRNVSAATDAFAKIQVILGKAQSRLASLMEEPIPVLNDTGIANVTSNLPRAGPFGLKKPTDVWVALFSIVAFLAIFPSAYRVYSSWHYQLSIAKSLQTSPPFDLLQTFHSLSHRTGVSIAETLSSLFISSGHHTRKTYVEWGVNFAISSNLNRLLHICIFLGFLGIANSTILESTKLPHCDGTTQALLAKKDRILQTSFLESLNRSIVDLMSAAVKELDENHISFVQHLKNATKLDLGNAVSPFASGLAVEYITLPATNNWSEPIDDHHDGAVIVSLLKSVNSAIWISSISLFALWIVFASSTCIGAFYKAYKTPESYGKYNTPTSRF